MKDYKLIGGTDLSKDDYTDPVPKLPIEVRTPLAAGPVNTVAAIRYNDMTRLISTQRATIAAQEGTIKKLQGNIAEDGALIRELQNLLQELHAWIASH